MKKLLLSKELCIFVLLLFIFTTGSIAVNAAVFTVTKIADTNDGVCDADCSLREAVTAADQMAGNDIIEFDKIFFNVPRVITLTGGAFRIGNSGGLVINGTGANLLTVSGNNQSGIFVISNPVNLTVNALTIANGNTSNDEGGILNFGTLIINDSVIKNNFAAFGNGGGIRNSGFLTVNRSEIIGNAPSGISGEGNTTTINNSSVSNNFGIGISVRLLVNINNSTIDGNKNGGISNFNGTVNLINSTVSNNFRNSVGGGIVLEGTNGTINLTNTTVAYNSTTILNGAGIYNGGGKVNARNSIIAGNTGGSSASDFSGMLNSQGYNIVGSTAFTTITGNTTGNLLSVDPLLLPLADNGGATRTHALQMNSPAIDAGDPASELTADQRGISRPFDGNGDGTTRIDIGAVEAGILVTNNNDNGAGSLRQAVLDANATPANDEIRFSTFFNTPRIITLTSGEIKIINNGTLFINGTGAETLAISGSNRSRVFFIDAETRAAISKIKIIDGNLTGVEHGGGIRVNSGGILTLNESNISNNAAFHGAGIYNQGFLTVNNSILSGNIGKGNGGGIDNISEGILNITDSIFTDNTADNGGGINNSGTAIIINSTIGNNLTSSDGGGIHNSSSSAVLSLTNSIISNNIAGAVGGGVKNNLGTANIINSTISGNKADNSNGGGIYHQSGTVNLINATIAFNSAKKGGGVFSSDINNSLINARNTIIAGNNSTNEAPDFFGEVHSQGYNLVSNISGTTITNITTGNQLNVDPLLLPLADNGGETKTHALQMNSPAIDAGDPGFFSATDQRGYNRTTDGDGDGTPRTDIGAFEAGTLVVNTNNSGAGSLRQAVLDARSGTGNDEIRLSNLFNSPQFIMLTSGELFVGGNGKLTINAAGSEKLTVSGNNQSRIFNVSVSADLTINNLAVIEGKSNDGGGIINYGNLTINNSVISGNTASGGGNNPPAGGGGIFNAAGKLLINNSSVSNNRTTAFNGGGILNSIGTAVINNSMINSNSGDSEGGGIANFNGMIDLSGSTVNLNTANRSGGILNAGRLTIKNSTVNDNVGQQLYGGIYNGQTLTITNSTISGNRTNSTGGGIFNLGAIIMDGSTISGNTANQGGGILNNGGINNDRGRLTMINSTISGNQAVNQGGGIYSIGGEVNLTASTVASNFSKNTGGGIFHVSNANGIFNARSVIIADNSAVNSTPDFQGVLTSQGYNLIENTTGTTITGVTTGNLPGVDPLLLPLDNYGGETKTHALRRSSPAVDKGNSFGISTDQRGQTRPFDFPNNPNTAGGDGSDIGAFERQINDITGSTAFDFDGDGKADISVFRPANGVWYLLNSQSGFSAEQFGVAADKIVPADYDGDGKTDIAVYRAGTWYLQRSSAGFTGFAFGAPDDVPQPADFDGDGKAELVVWRPSNGVWYVYNLVTNQFNAFQFGSNTDTPVVGDYDGDGKADYTVFRPSNGTWYVQRSRLGFTGIQFGDAADKPVAADYDGDGNTDIAVFRPSNGTWYLQRSRLGFTGVQFGIPTDLPTPADYDGDGKTDISVFRNGIWYIQQTTDGFTGVAFGTSTDKPLPNSFVQ